MTLGNHRPRTYSFCFVILAGLLAGFSLQALAVETHIGTVRLNSEVLCLTHCNDYYLEGDPGTAVVFLRGIDLPLFLDRRVQVYGFRIFCGGCSILNVTEVIRLAVTEVELIDDRQPHQTSLAQNYPNPFNPATDNEFKIAQPGQVSFKVYDVLGREIAALLDSRISPGVYRLHWNAEDLPSGIYVARLQHGSSSYMKKMMLLR